MPRPHSPLISREAAVRAGLQAIDEHGLEAFSLALLAKYLSVKPPSLYHHFRDRSEVLAEIARLIMLEADEPKPVRSGDWKEALVRLALSARRSILRHPNAAPLLLTYPPRHMVLSAYERSLRMLDRRGMPRALHMLVVQGMDNLMLGAALTTAYARSKGLPPFPQYDPAAFPCLATAARSDARDDEALFEAMTRSFLDGLPFN